MLAHHPSIRQHHHQFNGRPQPNSQPTQPQQSQQLAFLQTYFSSANSPSQPHFTAREAQSDLQESTPSSFESPSSSQSLDNRYMSNSFYNSNPAIRVQQSTPTPGLQLPAANSNAPHGLPFESNAYSHLWDTNYGGNGHMVATQSLPTSGMGQSRTHQRAQSSSSIGSSGSASPYSNGHATSFSYAGSVNSPTMNTASKLNQNFNVDQSSSSGFSNHLPTPTQTPTQDTFMAASYPSYNQQGHIDSAVAAHLAMHQAIDTTQHNDEDLPGMSHSGRQSISSMGQEPSTPRTIPENYEDFKQPAHGENSFPAVEAWINEYLRSDDVSDNSRHQNFPKLDRTVSDAYADELYNPAMQQPVMPLSKQKQFLSPHPQNIVTERLRAAQIARSQSPTSANSRGVSPFRPDSPWAQVNDQYRTGGRFGTAQQVRQQQKAKADAAELSQHMQSEDSQPKTISPKDALLEYNESEEDSKMPLFPQDNSGGFGQQFGDGQQQHFQQASGQAFASSMNANRWSNPNGQSAQTFSNMPISSQPQQMSGYNFASPAMPGNNINSLPFSSQNYRTAPSTMAASLKQEDTPDFPAQLTSMDSSASEAPPSSNPNNSEKSSKPTSSLADSGTYTCTYHGCSLRFETPQKLQKHKREGHRNPSTSAGTSQPPPSPGLGSGMTSADIMQRNSQAGPHKCERINPTTGKPCNTIFSRPYDLTRHEDTIHNARKQKVRCALCVEEKTFSRNDALTRHMR
jgi:hypothetical protein